MFDVLIRTVRAELKFELNTMLNCWVGEELDEARVG